MINLLFIKAVVSIASVLGLSLLTERAGPRLAGLLSGYPIGTAIALFFIGYENGGQFAGESALFALAGLTATLSFAAGYFYGSRLLSGRWGLITGCLGGLGAYLLACLAVRPLPLSLVIAILPPLAAILFFSWLFRHLPDMKIERPVRLGPVVLAFRALLAAGIIVAITGTAHLVGPEWAGLFAAFPITVFPLFLIIHFSYGPAPIGSFVRSFPRGMGALAIYCVSASQLYGAVGIGAGTWLSFAAATLYLLTYGCLAGYRRRKQAN